MNYSPSVEPQDGQEGLREHESPNPTSAPGLQPARHPVGPMWYDPRISPICRWCVHSAHAPGEGVTLPRDQVAQQRPGQVHRGTKSEVSTGQRQVWRTVPLNLSIVSYSTACLPRVPHEGQIHSGKGHIADTTQARQDKWPRRTHSEQDMVDKIHSCLSGHCQPSPTHLEMAIELLSLDCELPGAQHSLAQA